MQRPQPETVTLNDILITEELSLRVPRAPNWQAEAEAMRSLGRQMAQTSESLIQTLVDTALELCQAGTTGVSLLETTPDGAEIFRWNVLAGTLAHHVGGSTPRNFSPCGVCLEQGSPVLFSHPEHYFTYFQEANTPVAEGLVLPLVADNHVFGTIWILSHDEERHFDSEDVRVMTSLADFTATALLLQQRQTGELLAANVALEAEIVERKQAEARSRALISNLPVGAAFVVERDLRYLLAEGEALAIAGFKPEDFIGRTIFEVLSPDLAASYEPMYRQALAGEPFEHEHNAHNHTYISRGTPLRAENGEIYAVLVISYDITERKRAEVALRESEERFRLFVTASSDIVYRMSADWREMLSLTGKNFLVNTNEPSQNWIETYIPPEEQPRVWAAIQNAIRTQSTFELEHPVIRHDGALGWTFSRAIPMLNEQGDIVEWFGTASDVTERKRTEAALRESELQRVREQAAREEERQRAEALAELDRTKTTFFSNVSHEFRTPLTLSLASLQDALSDRVHPLDPIQRERLELVHRNSLRLLKLVNTLLDFSRIEAGRMSAVYEPIDLALYTIELASVFRSAIERAGLQLIVDCPPLAEPVYVDREMWEKIVLNLLSNAFKFTFDGEIAVRLLRADDHHVKLQVEDTGTGIEPEELPHLGQRFYQVRGAKARTHEGSGIGLALVHELIEMHGGTVEVGSTLGQGSCFTVTIPLGTAHLPSERLRHGEAERIQATRTLTSTALGATPYVQEAERWIGEEAEDLGISEAGENLQQSLPSAPEPQSPSARILIVDDNADLRDYLTRILSEHVEVKAVADGAAALAAVNEQLPDLVLSDVMMPGLDGFELLKALRANARTKEVPIILLSARAGEESVIEGLQAGADDYLIKPFRATELVTRVIAYLQLAQERSEALRFERTINQRKDEVLSTVSHELNTPLVAILGWTRLLRSSPPNQAMLWKSLETIERNATLQAKLVQDLLDISRITAGKISLNLEPVELQGVIDQASATVRQSKETKDIHLDCLLAPLPTIVQGDPERLQQIFLNLLTNAVKFTPLGGRIEVRLLLHENQAHVRITDTGCGINGDFLPYIFDTFRQADGVKKGLGLGLAIARHLVELHGGTIHAESPGVGLGATFTVKLPRVSVSL